MISADNFRVSRDEARARLDPDIAKQSFGYFIDFANAWETFRNPEETLSYLGIHKTHESQFPEILTDLGRLTAAELDWARRYLEFFDRVGRLISTTARRPDLQFDIAETAFDWRTVRQFVSLPARILDYGAGSGRQCVSAFLLDPDVIYTAVDSTLAAYTVQNVVFSLIGALRSRRVFTDFLDVQLAAESYPDIRIAAPGSIFHVPAWFDHAHLPERFYDLMFACHVHGELSQADFRRLIAVVDRCLADEGVLYVRSELAIPFPKGYFESIDLHGLDIVEVLRSHGIVPVYCTYQCAFQTTVFARAESAHASRARESSERECRFLDAARAMDMTLLAGRHFVQGQIDAIVRSGGRVLLSGRGFESFETLIAPELPRIAQQLVLDHESDPLSPEVAARVTAFNPDVIVAAAANCNQIAAHLRTAAGGTFALTRHHVMPVAFSYRSPLQEWEPGLRTPVFVAGDIERNRSEEPRWSVVDGGGVLASSSSGRGVR